MGLETESTLAIKRFLWEIGVDEGFWNVWTASPACCLHSDELIIVKGYILTGSHDYSCFVLHISNSRAEEAMESCKRRIKWAYAIYKKWLAYKLIEEADSIHF